MFLKLTVFHFTSVFSSGGHPTKYQHPQTLGEIFYPPGMTVELVLGLMSV